MTNKRSTKCALLLSALSLLLCVSMLVGSTFAWFTDSVTSGQNTIQSGNLDVELYYTYDANIANDKTSDQWKKVTKDIDVFGYDLWEPGYTKVAYFMIKNEGSLELKYQLAADVYEEKAGKNQAGAEFLLSDYIKTALVEVGATRDQILAMEGTPLKNSYDMSKGSLAAGASEVVGLAIWMPATVDNRANHNGKDVPEITFGINLLATQMNAESDSFGSDYDKDAWTDGMKVYNANDLQAAINNGESAITLMENIEVTEPVNIPAGATVALNLNGKTIKGNTDPAVKTNLINNYGTITLTNGTFVKENNALGWTIYSEGVMTLNNVTVKGADQKNMSYAVVVDGANAVMTINNSDVSGRGGVSATGGAKLTINGGKYHTPNVAWGHAVYAVDEGTEVVINDGTFSEGYEMASDNWGMYQIYSGKKAKVVVNGGNFLPWDCANGYDLCTATEGVIEIYGGSFAEDPSNQGGKNYVAAGYKAVDNGNGTYTVLPAIVGVDLKATEFAGIYTGKDKTYYVADKTGLMNLNALFAKIAPNEGNINTVELLADVDLSGEKWEPINTMWVTFNGNGHTISNLTASMAADGRRSGFWSYAGAVTINDLTLENVDVTGSQVGAFAGAAEALKLNNCFLKGDNKVTYIDGIEDWNGIGAITGVATGSTLNVTIDADATVTLNKAGFVTDPGCTFIDNLTGYIQANQGTIVNNGKIAIGVSNTAELIGAVKNAPVGEETNIILADGTYTDNIDITVAALGSAGGDVVIKAADGTKPVIAGTVTIGYRQQNVGAASYNAKITFDGITFDHAEAGKHCLNVQDVESFYMVNCTVIGDGEYGLSTPGSNGTGAAKIEKCKFINAGLQISGKFAQTLLIDCCEFEESVINVQGGGPLGPTIQNSEFDITLTAAHSGESFYVIRNSNAGANIKVKNCEISVDAEQGFTGVAGSKGWGVFVNRIASYDIAVEDVKITMTDAALAQSALNVAKCLSTGKINMTNVTLNGKAV